MRHRALWTLLLVGIAACAARAADRGTEVVRDTWGIPHVFAGSEEAGFFGLGYACAEDRLLQMELIRRKAAGRLAEVFGPDWLDADREARIAGHAAYAPRAFGKLPSRWQKALCAYAAGVNAWAREHKDAVARRFRPLDIAPEPWTPADCLLAARGILSLGSPFNAAPIDDYHRFRELVAQVGETGAAGQSGMVIDDAVAIVSESEMAKDQPAYRRLKHRPRMPGFELRGAGTAPEPRRMSHAWAVGGRRSTTGKPILESDPQLPLSSPPFFYEFHLAAGRIDARGLGIPGCPGLFIGWNRRVAWGATALGVDSHVLFLDRLTPDGKHYLFEGKPVPFQRRLERIEVKGGQAVVQEVLTSRHGTVFNALVRQPRPAEAYLCYDAQTMDAGASARMMLEVMDAGNWTEFCRALEHYYYPGLHVVYADVEGNVGYHTMVHRPLTARSPRRALEGWTGRDEVLGRIPFDELPHLLNPEAGCVSHANNLPVGSWYPYDLGLATGGTGDTSRSLRLRQLLDGDRKFSVDDFERVLHRDDVNPLVAALLPIARKVVEEDKVSEATVLRLLESLKGWDLHAGTAGAFPAARGLENTLTPYRGSGMQNVYGAGGGGVSHLARDVGARFARDGSTPANPLVRAYLVNWLRASSAAAGTRGGRGAAGSAGRTIAIPYQRTIPHNLPVVDASLDVTSPPLTCLDQGTIWSQPGNLYSQIVDLADVDNSRSMIAPGNAEDAAGPFRANQVDLWVRGTTHPAPLSRAAIEKHAVARTKLAAAAYSGPVASPERSVGQLDPAARLIPAIPPPAAATQAKPPLPGRKPDDPTLEAAFRYLLRNERTPAEIDAKLDEVKQFVSGKPALETQLREALKLGAYLIEESQAGRLKVKYGTPHCLKRMRELLKDPDRSGLIGYWPLRGDCRDHSGAGRHGVNHGVDLQTARFNGKGSYVEVPGDGLSLGTGDFTISAWVSTDKHFDDVLGDVLSQYDPKKRKGVNLYLRASAGGYNSQGDDRHVYFGIDNARLGPWEDCGRPSPTSNYVSNSMTVFDGSLYVGITDAEKKEDWAHVFRYKGRTEWEDCGRVTDLEAHGAGPMIVHQGSLYVATWNYDWTRVAGPPGTQPVYDVNFCRVYRYAGGKQWIDCGQPGKNKRLFGIASYRGSLYVVGDDQACHRYRGGTTWERVGQFLRYGHPMGIHDGRLFVGLHNPASVQAYDGTTWKALPNPSPPPPDGTQTHAFDVFRGRLHVTTWPLGTVERLTDQDQWETLGRLGDAMEINGLVVYNGKFYGGSIPRAEVFRYDDGTSWTSVGRFLEPADYRFQDAKQWARVTSLTVYGGKLFAGMGSCTSSHLDAPADFRGRVYAIQAGRCASYDRDLGPGWKHLTAIRRGDRLELYVQGKLVATSSTFNPADYDLTSGCPLRIGFGELDYFSGRIREVRLYRRALDAGEVSGLAAAPAQPPPG